jgi:hypothetical protein
MIIRKYFDMIWTDFLQGLRKNEFHILGEKRMQATSRRHRRMEASSEEVQWSEAAVAPWVDG